ncbi:hypothetical protein [Chryseobacterium sp. GVT01B]|uniref:hypothetical protein n=1 Tax=unclassified Chryseobacterium TaxID=2593645 RepID=UPI001CBF0F64|nr:hypothetical protein [Chryseobacterium sp. GVT01B]
MKKIFNIILLLSGSSLSFGQVGIGTANPVSSSILDVTSSNKGVLIPRVALLATNNTSPLSANIPDGTMVFNTGKSGTGTTAVIPGVYIWINNRWIIPAAVGTTINTKAAKFNNLSSSTTNFNPNLVSTPVNIDIFSSTAFNDDPVVIEKLNNYQVRLNASGLYLVSANLALRQNPAAEDSEVQDYIHFNLDGVLASSNISTVVPQNNPSDINTSGRFAFGSISYIYATAGQVLTLQSTRAANGTNGTVNFDGVSLSSVTIIKLQ